MKFFILSVLLFLGSVTMQHSAEARPGGGHSSSSSSSSSHSSSSSGGSGYMFGSPGYSSGYGQSGTSSSTDTLSLVELLVIVMVVILILWLIIKSQENKKTFTSRPTLINRDNQKNGLNEQLALLKQSDANFSRILFLEFVHSLYNKFYSYSTHPEFANLSPFLSDELQQHFKSAQTWTITEIVINGLNILEINTRSSVTVTISVEIDANYTLHQFGKRSRYAVNERWQFFRRKGLLSAEPNKMQSLCCPHCAAPAHFTDGGICNHCGTTIQKGEMQWYLGTRVVINTEMLASEDLVSYAEEQGTELMTLKQTDLIEQMNAFQQQNNLSDWNQFWEPFVAEVVKAYFLSIYQQWSKGNLQAVRHLLSDRLYETNAFWLDLYSEHTWSNRLDNLNIQQIVLAKIERDKYYEAITVRIFAECNDYTVDAGGKVIGGSKNKLRRYSEYWTFVRRNGVAKHTAAYSLTQCPQCGAPADNMGQTAECGYCGSKISTGNFSWVIFLITQDEVYRG